MATARYIFIKDGRVRLNTNGTLPTTRDCACDCEKEEPSMCAQCYDPVCLWDPKWSVPVAGLDPDEGPHYGTPNAFTMDINGEEYRMYCYSSVTDWTDFYDETDRKYNENYQRYLRREISFPMWYDPDTDENEEYEHRSEYRKEWKDLTSEHSRLENERDGLFDEYMADFPNLDPDKEKAYREAQRKLIEWEEENLEKIPVAEEKYAKAKYQWHLHPAEEASENSACYAQIECVSKFRSERYWEEKKEYAQATFTLRIKKGFQEWSLSTDDCHAGEKCSDPQKHRCFENVVIGSFKDPEGKSLGAMWYCHTDKNIYLHTKPEEPPTPTAKKVAGGIFPFDFNDVTISPEDPEHDWRENVAGLEDLFITQNEIDQIPPPNYYLISSFACGFKQQCDGIEAGEFYPCPEVTGDEGASVRIYDWGWEECTEYPCGSGGSGGGDGEDSSEPESTSGSESESESSESSGSSSSSGGLRPSHSRSESESKNPCDIYPPDHTIYFTIYVTMSDVDTGECFYDFSFAEAAVRREDYGCSVSERDGTFELYYQSEYVGYYVSYDIETGEFVRGRIDTYNFPPIVAEKPEIPDCWYGEYAVIEIY